MPLTAADPTGAGLPAPQSPDAADRNAAMLPLPVAPIGASERAGVAAPYQPYTPGPTDFTATNRGPFGQTGYDIAHAISRIPLLGGLLNFGANQIESGALGGPQYELQQALGGRGLAGLRNPDANV